VPRLLLLVLGPLTVLGALEVGLRLFGFEQPEDLFIPDGAPGIYRTNPAFTRPYFPAHFDLAPLEFRLAARKPAGQFRIFVLGESAARGVPEPGFGLAPLLRAELRAAYPGKMIEVYDLGIVAINSHAVLETARAAAAFAPDLFVVYAGNNEVVGPFGPGSANQSAMPPLAIIRASVWVRRTRVGQLFAALASRVCPPREPQWRGMATFRDRPVAGDDPRLAAVYRNFARNLEDLTAVAHDCGAQVILATVATNLRDCPPFGPRHRPGLSAADLDRWERQFAAGRRAWECGDWAAAGAALEAAAAIDPEEADGQYLLGLVRDHARDWPGARRYLGAALHWDSIRFRPDAEINAAIRSVAAAHANTLHLVDLAQALGADPADGAGPCAGREVFWEHVHLNWAGNRRAAHLLAAAAGPDLFGPPDAPWPDDAACAQAVGYTPFGELRALRGLGPIISNPPFTQQLSYPDDQMRFQRLNEEANAAARAPGAADRARAVVAAGIANDPENAELRLRLAEVEFEGGQPAAALEALDAAARLLPPSAPLQVRRGRTLLALGRRADAQAEDLRAVDTDPYHLPAYTELEAAARQTGDFAAVETVLQRALARNPDSDYLRLALADLWFDQGRRDAAAGAWQAVLRAHPDSAEALQRLVALDRATGQADAALALMAQALDTQPANFSNALALATLYDQRHDPAGVARSLQVAVRAGPAPASVHLYLARLAAQRGRSDEARVELARAQRAADLAGQSELAARIGRQRELAP